MMFVAAVVKKMEMKIDFRFYRKGAKQVIHHLGGKVSNSISHRLIIALKSEAPSQINRYGDQNLIHRQDGKAIALDPSLVSQRLAQGLPEGNPDIFNCVVIIDFKISLRLNS